MRIVIRNKQSYEISTCRWYTWVVCVETWTQVCYKIRRHYGPIDTLDRNDSVILLRYILQRALVIGAAHAYVSRVSMKSITTR